MSAVYPPAPWRMHGQLWLSLFRVAQAVDDLRPAGVYGVAFVHYQIPSPLTYGELLVARPVKRPVKAVTITDIWVDSPASVAGGRELWAIPKGLCAFDWRERSGRVAHTEVSATIDELPICTARVGNLSALAPRLPFKAMTWQPGLASGIGAGQGERTAAMSGSAKTVPAKASWSFNHDGPLHWLADAKQIASVRMSDFRMSFG